MRSISVPAITMPEPTILREARLHNDPTSVSNWPIRKTQGFDRWVFSASDLIKFHEDPEPGKRRQTWADTRYQTLRKEKKWKDLSGTQKPGAENKTMMFYSKLGDEHEATYLQRLKDEGKDVIEIPDKAEDGSRLDPEDMFEMTLEAMRKGPEVIFQGYLMQHLSHDVTFAGWSDFLIRVQNPEGVFTDFGDGIKRDYHYEVWDTKLSKKSKTYHLIQLCCYAEMLEEIQGVRPERIAVVTGDQSVDPYETIEFYHFYRWRKKSFLDYIFNEFDINEIPDLTKGDFGRWNHLFKKLIEDSDHLSLITGITRTQIKRLNNAGLYTMEDLATTEVTEIPFLPKSTLERLKIQARLQVSSKGKKIPEYQVLDHSLYDKRAGLQILPPPSKYDMFFDMESNPGMGKGGLEYLFGYTMLDSKNEKKFDYFWADSLQEEKLAFENFVDEVNRLRELAARDGEEMHVYHYAHYEVAAMRRLALRHGTREREVEELINAGVFVDCYKIVQKGIAVGTPSNSIKYIEKLYRDQREGEVVNAVGSIEVHDTYYALPDSPEKEKQKNDIILYNKDDCDSTVDLVVFLRKVLRDYNRGKPKGKRIRYIPPETIQNVNPNLATRFDRRSRIEEKNTDLLFHEIYKVFQNDIHVQNERGKIAELVANLLLYHAREEKISIVDKMQRFEMTDEELVQDSNTLGNLEYQSIEILKKRPDGKNYRKGTRLITYKFDPEQNTKLIATNRVIFTGQRDIQGTIHEIDPYEGTVSIRLSKNMFHKLNDLRAPLKTGLIPVDWVGPGAIHDSLYEIAARMVEMEKLRMKLNGRLSAADRKKIEKQIRELGKDSLPALADFMFRRRPKIIKEILPDGTKVYEEGDLIEGTPYDRLESGKTKLSDVISRMDKTSLFVQGPPGSGKSTLTAEAILDLIESGKRVAISGPSHKAIEGIMRKVHKLAEKRGSTLKMAKIGTEQNGDADLPEDVQIEKSANQFFSAPGLRYDYNLIGGTPWAFSREGAKNHFDYLVIDEAGQVPIAHAAAIAPCADNIVLVGDPEQLPQPTKALHPFDSGKSVFEYILHKFKGHTTIPKDFGLFLNKTFRMNPILSNFISRHFYEGRLENDPLTNSYKLYMNPDLDDDGLDLHFPESGLVFFAVPHEDNRNSNIEEARFIDRVLKMLRRYLVVERKSDGEYVKRPFEKDDAVISAPYNAQVHMIKRIAGLDTRVGTVDKFQGQEAPVSILSVTSSGLNFPIMSLMFTLNPNRFNVGLSRAQGLSIVIASPSILNVKVNSIDHMRILNRMAELFFEYQGETVLSQEE